MLRFYKKAILSLILTSVSVFSFSAMVQATEDKIVPWQNMFVEGSSEALVKLAIYYGQNAAEPDPQRAFDLLLVASSKFNDPVAQTNLGLLYQFGQGVDIDYARAKAELAQAAAQLQALKKVVKRRQ